MRVSYWSGAIADFVFPILILTPSRMGEIEFRYPMGLASVVIFSWGILLLWANQKPFERKGILLLTIFPVLTGLIASAVFSYSENLISLRQLIPTLIVQIGLIVLLLFSYLNARSSEQGTR